MTLRSITLPQNSTLKIKLFYVTRIAYFSRSFSWTRTRLTISLPNLIPEIQTLGSPSLLFSNFSPLGSIIIDFEVQHFQSVSHLFHSGPESFGKDTLRSDTHTSRQPPPNIIRRTIQFKSHNPSETFKGHEIRNAASCKVRIRENAESFRAGIRTWYYLKRDLKPLLRISLDNQKIAVRFPATARGQALVCVPYIDRFNEYREIFLTAEKPKSETKSLR